MTQTVAKIILYSLPGKEKITLIYFSAYVSLR